MMQQRLIKILGAVFEHFTHFVKLWLLFNFEVKKCGLLLFFFCRFSRDYNASLIFDRW